MTQTLQKQISRFAVVGGLGFLVDIGVTMLLIAFGLDAFIARIAAIMLAVLTTWRLNRAITFGASESSQAREGMRYFAVAFCVAIVNYAIYAGLLMTISGMSPAIAIIIAVGCATVLSFCGYRLYAFKSAA